MQRYANLDHSAVSSLPASPEGEAAVELLEKLHDYHRRHRARRRWERVLRFVFRRRYRHGVTRIVVLGRRTVVKVPRFDQGLTLFLLGWLANRSERQKWGHARSWKPDPAHPDHDPALHLAPVRGMYLWGLVLLQARCEEITVEEGKTFIDREVVPSPYTPGMFDWTYWSGDRHSANFGRYEGRIVCFDYPD